MTENVNGIEVYTNKLFEVADSFIDEVLDGDIKNFKKSQSMQLIYYIHDRVETVSNDDISGLNAMFDAYVRLCGKFQLLPTLFQFAILSGNDVSTFSDWSSGVYRAKSPIYSQSSKRWKSVCEAFLADSLNNSEQTSVNRIFVAKSNYGWCETAPIQVKSNIQNELAIEDAKTAFSQFIEENRKD